MVLEEKLQRVNSTEEAKLNLLEEQLIKTHEACHQYKQGNELLEDRKTKEWKLIENNICLELSKVKQLRKEVESKTAGMIDDKTSLVLSTLAKNKKQAVEGIEKDQESIQT